MADIERKPAFEIIKPCACLGHKCVFLRTALSESDDVIQEAADGINAFIDREEPIELTVGKIVVEIDEVTEEIVSTDVFWRAELPILQNPVTDALRRCETPVPNNFPASRLN